MKKNFKLILLCTYFVIAFFVITSSNNHKIKFFVDPVTDTETIISIEPIPVATFEPTDMPTATPKPTPVVTPTAKPATPAPVTPAPVTTPTPEPKYKAVYKLPKSGMVCLTFDDGYDKEYVISILDCLKENNVHCTFFVVGDCLKLFPELWKQAIADGNEIAYHSMKHTNISKLNNDQVLADINDWNNMAHLILGDDYIIPKIARIPYGFGNQEQRLLELFDSIGYSVIAWNSDTYTGVYKNENTTPQDIADYILSRAIVGTISLQHFNKNDAPSIPLFIKALKEKFVLGTISEAMKVSE